MRLGALVDYMAHLRADERAHRTLETPPRSRRCLGKAVAGPFN